MKKNLQGVCVRYTPETEKEIIEIFEQCGYDKKLVKGEGTKYLGVYLNHNYVDYWCGNNLNWLHKFESLDDFKKWLGDEFVRGQEVWVSDYVDLIKGIYVAPTIDGTKLKEDGYMHVVYTIPYGYTVWKSCRPVNPELEQIENQIAELQKKREEILNK